MDITSTNLELALLDQRVAGLFGAKPYAYIATPCNAGWTLGIAVANERGYHPIAAPKSYATSEEARSVATGMNEHIGLSQREADDIIISTMGGMRYTKGAA